jgi:hypothetical protein
VKNERPQKRKMDENGRGGERKEGKKGREESSIKVSWLFSLSPFVFYLFAHLVRAGAAYPGRFGSGGTAKAKQLMASAASCRLEGFASHSVSHFTDPFLSRHHNSFEIFSFHSL